MTATNPPGKFAPAPRGIASGMGSAPVPTRLPPAPPITTASSRWSPVSQPRRNAAPAAPQPVAAQPPSGAALARPPRPLASIELFQKAQALLLALPAQPPVLRREGVELIAALGAGYLNGDATSLIPALQESRTRCGRLLALLTALCPAQLAQFEPQLHGLHRACGYFIRYLRDQQKG